MYFFTVGKVKKKFIFSYTVLFQSVAEFLKGLPSHDENNFANFHTDSNNRTCVKRPSVYLPTKDYPSEQGKMLLSLLKFMNNKNRCKTIF